MNVPKSAPTWTPNQAKETLVLVRTIRFGRAGYVTPPHHTNAAMSRMERPTGLVTNQKKLPPKGAKLIS